MATPAATVSGQALKPAPLALLPPIPLYRRLLRCHRKYLNRDMRLLGDSYIKSEFRAHRNVDNPLHIVGTSGLYLFKDLTCRTQIGFLTEWQMYAQKVEGDAWKGEKLDKTSIDRMSGMYLFFLVKRLSSKFQDQQLGQLHELMLAIQRQSGEDNGGDT